MQVSPSPFSLPLSVNRDGLNDIINALLQKSEPISFIFAVNDVEITGMLGDCIQDQNLEEILTIHYFVPIEASESDSTPTPAWISSIHATPSSIFTTLFDGTARLYNRHTLQETCVLPFSSTPLTCSAPLFSNQAQQNKETSYFIVGDKAGDMRLGNMQNGASFLLHSAHETSLSSIQLSPSQQVCVCFFFIVRYAN